MELKLNGTYKTRAGDMIKIVSQSQDKRKFAGWIGGTIYDWQKNGHYFNSPAESGLDIVEEVKVVSVFVNLYSDGSYTTHEDEEQAEYYRLKSTIGDVKFEKRLSKTWEV